MLRERGQEQRTSGSRARSKLLVHDFDDRTLRLLPAKSVKSQVQTWPITKIKCLPFGEHLILVDMDMTVWKQIKLEITAACNVLKAYETVQP